MTPPVPADVISRLKAVLGEGGWSEDAERLAPKLVEWRDRWSGTTPLLAAAAHDRPRWRPSSRVCAEAGMAITPQGGNTGLVGGQIPQGEVLLSTERLRAIREVDALDDVIVAEAGVTLAAVQTRRPRRGARFPLGLASEGSARSAASSPPTPAAPRCCATAPCATWCWAWRRCCRTARFGTA